MFGVSLGIMDGAGGAAGGSFESIATQVGTGSSATLTFSSIPSTYKHLQIRLIANDGSNNYVALRFNGDTGANYAQHLLIGDGANVLASANTLRSSAQFVGQAVATTSMVGASIIDIHDYGSTTKNKTIRTFHGWDTNNSGADGGIVRLTSALWLNTAAVTSITLLNLGANFSTTSVFSLYGIKG
jgi:hypothetical protein